MNIKNPLQRLDTAAVTRKLMASAIEIIDTALGADYARKNPELLGRLVQSMLADDMKIRELNATFYYSTIGISLSTPAEPSA